MDLSRPSSPTKSVRVKSSVTSSLRKTQSQSSRKHDVSRLSPPTVRVAIRPQPPKSTPSTPEPLRSPGPLHHALSFSSLQPSSKLADATIRITSKVSGLAKSIDASPTQSASKPVPITPAPRHTRTASASSTLTSPPILYPITTAAPAANPYRYSRPHPPDYKHVPAIKTDQATLPPLSPPISSVSISSHSSVSYSSAVSRNADGYSQQDASASSEHLPKGASSLNGHRHRNSSSDSHDSDWAEDDDSDALSVKATAKSNRKIADLEITNKSLMAYNASLETTKHKQAKEISELRRKLRESRLILPPPAYRAIQSSGGTADEDEDGEEEEEDEDEETDDAFLRVKAMLENLLESGKQALETKVADYGGAGSAAKVLSAEEVRSWRRVSVERDDSLLPPLSVDSSDIDEIPLDIDQSTIDPSTPPPIFVTPSP